MRKFWVFYRVLPILLFIGLISVGLHSNIAAAPGVTRPEASVEFAVPDEGPNPNEIFKLVNQQRVAQGLPPLKASEKLGKVAQARANDMASRQYYAHQSPDGSYYYDYFESYTLSTNYSCENLDLIFEPSQEQIIDDWKTSLNGHRDCMLHAKTDIAGYATAKLLYVHINGSQTTTYVVVAVHAQVL